MHGKSDTNVLTHFITEYPHVYVNQVGNHLLIHIYSRFSVKDVRPGLVFKQSIKRRFQVEENQKASNEKHRKIQKPAKVLEIERREEGLSMAIATENKGFAMLQKMGFKPGQGLGKSGEGRTEPLAVEIKADRGGLGRDAAVKDVAQRKLELLKRRIASQSDETSLGAFRNRKKDEALQRINLADLNKSRRMVYTTF